jgi:ligand-binding SRPBCC domain-containing protein
MPVFHRQCSVKAHLKAVYDFHVHPQNLPQVQPPYPRIISFHAPDSLKMGDYLELELGPFPRQSWKVLVEELIPPQADSSRALLIDRALRGPFPFFQHRHRFVSEGNSTWIQDTIDFDPPYGKIGWLLLPFIHLTLHLMFQYRYTQTRRLLEKL